MADPEIVRVAGVDLTDPALYRTGIPHQVFTDLRAAGAVHRHPPVPVPGGGDMGFWSVVRHDEIEIANRDWESFSAVDGPGIVPSSLYRDARMIVAMEPPEHTRLRRLISAGFTPRMVGRLEQSIETRAEAILDDVIASGDTEIDFVTEIASPLPMHVIADIVGIPEADRPWVFERTDRMLRGFDPTVGTSDEDRTVTQLELFGYAQELSETKRAHPTDDIWSTLTLAEIEGDDGNPTAFTAMELDAFFMILAIAGSETTRNALTQGLMALLENPDQMSMLSRSPELLPSAADEMLRWSSPVLMFGRTATRDVDLGGVRIPAGDRVVLWYPSGNRDETTFADPFRFDVTRQPNPHVSFGGGGIHYCLGANLAKKEMQVMIGAVLRRFRSIELTGAPIWMGAGPVHNVGVSIEHLPVRLTAS